MKDSYLLYIIIYQILLQQIILELIIDLVGINLASPHQSINRVFGQATYEKEPESAKATPELVRVIL